MKELAQYYKILGLEITATPAEIKQAYRSLVKQCHPDLFIGNLQRQKQAQEEIQKINQAYEFLKDRDFQESNNQKPNNQQSNVTRDAQIHTKKTSPEIHYQRGVDFAEAEQYEEAITEFTHAIKINSEYLKAYQYRAFILAKLGYELRADSDFKTIAILKNRPPKQKSTTATPSSKDYQTPSSVKSEFQSNQYWQCWQTLFAHRKTVSAISLSGDRQFFVSSSKDGNVKLWRTYTGRVLATLKNNSIAINDIALSNNGKILITANQDGKINFWNLENRKFLQTLSSKFSGHKDKIIALVLDSYTNSLITCGADNLVIIWDLNQGKKIREIPCTSGDITCLAIKENQGYFCHGGKERQLRIREITTGKVLRSLRGDSEVLTLAFSRDGKFLAAGQINCQIQIWNLKTGNKHCTLIGHQDRISSLTFSHDNQTLVSGSWDNTIKLWDIATATLKDTLTGHSDKVSALTITPDKKTIISGSKDCSIKIWQPY